MEFEIDVSGEDIFDKDYVICVTNKDNIIKGFKFSKKLLQILRSKYGQGLYRYGKSKKHRGLFKIRLYSIIVYYLIKSIDLKEKNIDLEICRDFEGHEEDIKSNLRYFLEILLGLNINIKYTKLPKDSNADKYAALMRSDTKNKMSCYVKISLEDIERFLRK